MKQCPRPRWLTPCLLFLVALAAPLFLEPIAAQEESGQEKAERKTGQAEPQQESPPRRRLGPNDGETSLELGEQVIRITWLKLETDSRDYPALEELDAGETFAFSGGRAVKLLTDLDLDFGGVRIRKGNASPDYPGVYSLWLRRTDSGWSLVFNSDADIWGTQRLADRDVAEVSLAHQTVAESQDKLDVELIETDDSAGRLRIAWGSHEWTTPFQTH